MFAGITEHAFMATLGIADPPLIDYISGILTRFLHSDDIYRLRNGEGRPIQEVGEMIREAEQLPAEGKTRREVHRHIADFTLYWTGLYPESVQRARSGWTRDLFVSYCETGKRCYLIASQCDGEQSILLRRLSSEFELCAYGLHHVRKEFEAIQAEGNGRVIA
jgi:hypothetical protein